MKTSKLLGASLALTFLGGCAMLDKFFGVDAGGQPVAGGASPAGTLGGLLGAFLPWGTTILGAAGTIYSHIRGRNYKAAAVALAPMALNLFEELDADGDGRISKDELAEALKRAQEGSGLSRLLGK